MYMNNNNDNNNNNNNNNSNNVTSVDVAMKETNQQTAVSRQGMEQ
jgi:hypothetical protein